MFRGLSAACRAGILRDSQNHSALARTNSAADTIMTMSTKTYMAKPGEVEQHWWLADGSGKVVGRLASQLAMVLMGKHRPTYTPHVDTGDFVVLINADKIKFTGNKWEQKKYTWYTGYPGLRKRNSRQAACPPAGNDHSRGRAADAPQKQAGRAYARQAEDLHRRQAPAPGPAARAAGNQGEEIECQRLCLGFCK